MNLPPLFQSASSSGFGAKPVDEMSPDERDNLAFQIAAFRMVDIYRHLKRDVSALEQARLSLAAMNAGDFA